MPDTQLRDILLALGAAFSLSYLLAGCFARFRIPGILAALVVAIAIQHTWLGALLLATEFQSVLAFLSQLGVLFLLFFIGLQIDIGDMLALGRDILWLTVLKVLLTLALVGAVMFGLGYGALLALIVGLTRVPTAEAVIIPILDEFGLIRTRVGEIIIGTSILDDVIEVLMVALVSIWISGQLTGKSAADGLGDLGLRITGLLLILGLSYRVVVPWLSHWLPRRVSNMILLAMLVLFSLCGLAEWAGIGMVGGAICAGLIVRPSFDRIGVVGEQARQVIQAVSYGFLAQVFFFSVGLHVDLAGLVDAPLLTTLLVVSALAGKLLSVWLMVPLHRINTREAWTIGVSVNAGLTTEIIVAQLMLNAKMIDPPLFTALVAASSVSTVCVPLVLAMLLRRWRDHISTRF